MQRIVGVSLVLLGLGWLASQLPATADHQSPLITTSWRRTCDGWERADWLGGGVSHQRPALHPAIVGLTQLLLALAALIGLASEAKPESPARAEPASAVKPPAVRRQE